MLSSLTVFRLFSDSINAHALEHESAMVDTYTKLKPDSFKSQLQAVLTTSVLRGHQGGSGRQRLQQDQGRQVQIQGPRGRRRQRDRRSRRRRRPGRRLRRRPCARRRPPSARRRRLRARRPRPGGGRRQRRGAGPQPCRQGIKGKEGQGGPSLMPIKLVCLNFRRDTWQQQDHAYRPACRANQKAAPKRVHQCTYTVRQCLYNSLNVCSHLYTEHQLYIP
jgi:hypothetical protein